jgi:hypothetical protein
MRPAYFIVSPDDYYWHTRVIYTLSNQLQPCLRSLGWKRLGKRKPHLTKYSLFQNPNYDLPSKLSRLAHTKSGYVFSALWSGCRTIYVVKCYFRRGIWWNTFLFGHVTATRLTFLLYHVLTSLCGDPVTFKVALMPGLAISSASCTVVRFVHQVVVVLCVACTQGLDRRTVLPITEHCERGARVAGPFCLLLIVFSWLADAGIWGKSPADNGLRTRASETIVN